MQLSWFSRLRTQFFAVNVAVVIVATVGGVLEITQQAGRLSQEVLSDHMGEVSFLLATQLEASGDPAQLPSLMLRFREGIRVETTLALVTDSQGTILAATQPSLVGQTWQEAFSGVNRPVPTAGCMAASWASCREGLFSLGTGPNRSFDMARTLNFPAASDQQASLTLHVLLSQNAISIALSRTISVGLSLMIGLLVLLSLVQIDLVNRWIFQPLERLTEADQAFAEGRSVQGHLLVRTARPNEMTALIESREIMLSGLEALLGLSSSMLLTRNNQEVAHVLVDHLGGPPVNASRGVVWTLDPADGALVPIASFGATPDTLPEFQLQPDQLQPQILGEAGGQHPILSALEMKQGMLLPIQVGSQVIGVAAVESARGGFTAPELRMAQSSVHYAALALERLGLYQHIQEESQRMSGLAQISARLTTERNLDTLLLRACRESRQLFQCRAALVLLAEQSRLRLAAQEGLTDIALDARALVEAPQFKVLATRAGSLVVEDIDRDRPDLRALPLPDSFKSLQAFSLQISVQIRGVLILFFEAPHRSSPAEAAMGETLMAMLGALIENATAFSSLERQRSLLMTVSEVGTEISSILDPSSLYNRVCELLASRLRYEHVHILVVEEGGRSAVFVGGSGPRGRTQVDQMDRIRIDEKSINTHVMITCRPYLAQDVRTDPYYLEVPALPGIRSEMSLPILSGGTLLGMLDLQATRPYAFSDDDQFVLQIVVEQLAAAILNARQHEAVREQARRDSLTQVLSHGAFVAELEKAVTQARGQSLPLSLIMLDIDYFKDYNDRFGHVAGDAALLSAVDAIRRHIKHGDLLGRWGGEEFAMALPNATSDQAHMVAERIQHTLAQLRPIDSLGRQMPSPTVSQGIASLGIDAGDAFALVDVADRALYRAKARGRNQVEMASEADRRPLSPPTGEAS
jgi:diguanylate cyclase (GGDEF)-like protein